MKLKIHISRKLLFSEKVEVEFEGTKEEFNLVSDYIRIEG